MNKKTRMRFYILLFFVFIFSSASAQLDAFTRYYDSARGYSPRDSAVYYTEFIKNDTVYKCKTYWTRSNKMYESGTYTDIHLKKPFGLILHFYETGILQDSVIYDKPGHKDHGYSYFKSGHLSDSIFYDDHSEVDSAFHYYENGKLWVHYSFDKNSKKKFTEAFDSAGNIINNFIYEKEAEYPGGSQSWRQFLIKNLDLSAPIKKGVPSGLYTTVIRFIVGKDGLLSDIKAETKYGFGLEEEAMRVIKKSYRWLPAIYLNKNMKAYFRQPVAFAFDEQ